MSPISDLDQDPEHQDPFVTALQGEHFADIALSPWTPARIVAAQCMGMLYPYIGDDGYEAIERTGVYPGALRDVIIFLWLRQQKDPAVLRAQRKPGEAWALATTWAATAGLIDLTGKAFKEAYQLFADKQGARAAATGTPDVGDTATGIQPPPKA